MPVFWYGWAMNKIIEPAIEPTMTRDEEAYVVARARQGLADIEAGRTMTVEEARVRMNEHATNRGLAK